MRIPASIWHAIARVTFILMVVLLTLVFGCSEPKSTAEGTVTQFHNLFNSGQYSTIYAQLCEPNPQSTEADAEQFLQFVRANLGNFLRADLSDSYQHELFTDDAHIKLTYRTTFDRGTAAETFTFHVTNGRALLISSICNSPQLDGLHARPAQ